MINAQFEKTKEKLINFVKSTDITDKDSETRTFNYLNWLEEKTDLIINEKNFNIPMNIVPDKIDKYMNTTFRIQEKDFIEQFYDKVQISNSEIEYVKKQGLILTPKQINEIIKTVYIRRPYVVWINFGFNIDKEFGGKHPALILKRTEDSIFVLPLSSGDIPYSKRNKDYCKVIPCVQGLKPLKRWVNAYRIICVSIQRIDFNSNIGRLQGKYMKNVIDALEYIGIGGIIKN